MSESQSWIFGTAADCDVRVTDDPYVSPHHCRVTLYDNGTVTVEDLGSTKGTQVIPGFPGSGAIALGVHTPVPKCRIQLGWTIRIGRTDIPWRRP